MMHDGPWGAPRQLAAIVLIYHPCDQPAVPSLIAGNLLGQERVADQRSNAGGRFVNATSFPRSGELFPGYLGSPQLIRVSKRAS